jgi:hypothetical protein
MSDEKHQINTRETNSLATNNISKIDTLIVKQVEDSMSDLDGDILELDSVMTVLRDRMMESPEASFPISLARFAEIKLATRKQKNELLKTLIQYKTGEQMTRKRSNDSTSSIQDIMAGVGLGTVMSQGGKLNISAAGTGADGQRIQVERTDIIDAEIELEEGETTSNLFKGKK